MSKMICKQVCGNEQETGLACSRCGANLVLFNYPININAEDQAILQELNGIGPVLADEIINNRPFNDLKSLENISGISEEMLQEWSNLIKLGKGD